MEGNMDDEEMYDDEGITEEELKVMLRGVAMNAEF